jgi:hypothetical protein
VIIFSPVAFHIDRWLKQGVRLSVFLLAAVVLAAALLFLLYPWRSRAFESFSASAIQKGGKAQFPYESIGSGALALHPRYALGWVSRLADELALIAYNSRPDVHSEEAKILISLRSGKEQVAFPNGKTLFLRESDQGKGLHFSEAATPLWVKPILLDNGAVLVEAGRKSGGSEELGQFVVTEAAVASSRYSPGQLPFVKELKAARCLGPDLFVQRYGGREYSSWRDKVVLELARGSATYACFVSAGDFLVYDEEQWRVAEREELKADLPVALVRAVSSKAVEIEAWDETGFYPLQVKVEMEKQIPFHLKPEVMPTGIRLRSASQVSCAFGKRRVILKPGDWLLKTVSGWRNLRRADEIEQYLNRRLKGELFIFDAIEKQQGKMAMKGQWFDETRTQVQQVTFPIDAEKPQGKSGRKRKSAPIVDRRVA